MEFLLLLCFFLTISLSSGDDTIFANQSLSGDQTIVSKGEKFELGFFKAGNSSNYYIGIWYKHVSSSPTIVWVANRETPISDRFSSELKIKDGNLVLLNESNALVWSTNMIPTALPASLALLDDGNLVLRYGSSSRPPIWQSFDHPTHTFMPGSKLGYNKRTNTKQVITSWRNKDDPAPGLFSLEFVPEKKQSVLKWNGNVLNWKTRYQIAVGIARGLVYLHEKCRDCIIHCDIKPENILLDADFCPKIADFGLAKLVGREFSRVLTTMRGTRGNITVFGDMTYNGRGLPIYVDLMISSSIVLGGFSKLEFSFSSGADTISANESLSGNQTIISKGGNFELGFFKPGNSSNYYIGIWYKKVQSNPPTIVWVANRETPISDTFISELKIVNDNLVLFNEFKVEIWSTNVTTTGLNSVTAVLLDDGNLVLRDGSNLVEPVWQSFDHPVHTWLPGAKLAYDNITKKSQLLTSWRSNEDPGLGVVKNVVPGVLDVNMPPVPRTVKLYLDNMEPIVFFTESSSNGSSEAPSNSSNDGSQSKSASSSR
ncbi:hypothetical protein QVD17_03722 [Tagetes erecta]|uniref:Uncharacterized protein n=1 Tax=Tagetes erecta TaxID=13708 RepID=A0AAD8LG95_TARER|nr:hypothetical protein QVD17_03722 [Tagetes erecta]